jgi:hypothetical protein
MFKLAAIIVDFVRSLLIEAASGRVRDFKVPRRARGMNHIRRRIHRKTLRRLLNRLSTEIWN